MKVTLDAAEVFGKPGVLIHKVRPRSCCACYQTYEVIEVLTPGTRVSLLSVVKRRLFLYAAFTMIYVDWLQAHVCLRGKL